MDCTVAQRERRGIGAAPDSSYGAHYMSTKTARTSGHARPALCHRIHPKPLPFGCLQQAAFGN